MCIPNVQLQRSRGARGTPGRGGASYRMLFTLLESRDRHAYRVYTLSISITLCICVYTHK